MCALEEATEGPVQRNTTIVRSGYIVFAIILAGAIVYGKSITYGLTYSDDARLVSVNRDLLSSWANVPKFFTSDAFLSATDQQMFYRPLLNVFLLLETIIGNGSLPIFHLGNITLHLASSLLLFVILQQMGCRQTTAGLAGLVFCVHPLNTSAVAWIPGCNDTLLALLLFGSFSFFLSSIRTNRTLPLILHSVLFFLALLTKESAIMLPLFTISYALFFCRGVSRRKVWSLALLCYAIPLLIWYLLRSSVPNTFTVHMRTEYFIQSTLGNWQGLLLYLGKVFFPFNMSIFPSLADHSVWPGFVCLALLLAACYVWRPVSPARFVWGLGWFFLFLAPTFVSSFIFFEHRAYVAEFGLLFAIAQLPIGPFPDTSRISPVYGVVALLVFLGILTMVHSEDYRDRAAYALAAYRLDPSIDGSYTNLAALLVSEGKSAGAENLLRKGLERNPTMSSSHRMLADILADRRAYNEAAREYDISLRLNPLQLYTYVVYGKMCLEAGRIDDASRLWEAAVRINPGYILAYYYLANFYVQVKANPDSAMLYVRQMQFHGERVIPELLEKIQAMHSAGVANESHRKEKQ